MLNVSKLLFIQNSLNPTYINSVRNYAMKLAFYNADSELFERYIKGVVVSNPGQNSEIECIYEIVGARFAHYEH